MSGRTVFLENGAAAQSLKNRWTRMASTYQCMRITLTEQALELRPRWFASLPIALLRLDLSHRVPIAQITGVEDRGIWFGYGRIEVHFRDGDADRAVLLYLHQHAEFSETLARLIQTLNS